MSNFQKKYPVLFSEEQIKKRLIELAVEINKGLASEEPLIVIPLMTGALVFAADLIRELNRELKIYFMAAQSYDGLHSSGQVKLYHQIKPKDLIGAQVLIIEDIVDSGLTLQSVKQELKNFSPKWVKTCSLLSKPTVHKEATEVEFVGFEIPNIFVVGYGMDYNGLYRNYKEIRELK